MVIIEQYKIWEVTTYDINIYNSDFINNTNNSNNYIITISKQPINNKIRK